MRFTIKFWYWHFHNEPGGREKYQLGGKERTDNNGSRLYKFVC